jgi:hypothetical protein
MVKSNYREYLRGDKVRLKKYLYVLRPLLAVKWMEQGRGRVPMELETLLGCLENERVESEIKALVERKANGEELALGDRIDELNRFIEKNLERLAEASPLAAMNSDIEPLNQIFREVLREAWNGHKQLA